MIRGQFGLAAVGAMAFAAVPAIAQDTSTQPTTPAPAAAVPAFPVDPAVAAYYALRPGARIWFRDADTRGAAMNLPAILRRAPIDGLADGPVLATQVEAAIARGQPADELIISHAWVRLVQALNRPIEGISYGDP